jgi:hypothetical protein
MTGLRKTTALTALLLSLAAAPARSADCQAMQDAYARYQAASQFLNQEESRYQAIPNPPKSDAVLCQAAKAAVDAAQNLEFLLDKSCLPDPSTYDFAVSQLHDAQSGAQTMAGLSCGPD